LVFPEKIIEIDSELKNETKNDAARTAANPNQ
jgi:hypothetical protein